MRLQAMHYLKFRTVIEEMMKDGTLPISDTICIVTKCPAYAICKFMQTFYNTLTILMYSQEHLALTVEKHAANADSSIIHSEVTSGLFPSGNRPQR